jgi:Ribonuclease G/E
MRVHSGEQNDAIRQGLARLLIGWVAINGLTWRGAARCLGVKHGNQIWRIARAKDERKRRHITVDALLSMLDRAGVQIGFTYVRKSLIMDPRIAKQYGASHLLHWKRQSSRLQREELARAVKRSGSTRRVGSKRL